ncbi:MAG: transposase, partial [Proteobacteria bacterium]|nr:transposase [Pseudomonadota bacterium]
MTDTRGRTTYSTTRKSYAVDLYQVGASVGQVAGARGVPSSTVARWIRAAGVMRQKQVTKDRMATRELEERTGVPASDPLLTGPPAKP